MGSELLHLQTEIESRGDLMKKPAALIQSNGALYRRAAAPGQQGGFSNKVWNSPVLQDYLQEQGSNPFGWIGQRGRSKPLDKALQAVMRNDGYSDDLIAYFLISISGRHFYDQVIGDWKKAVKLNDTAGRGFVAVQDALQLRSYRSAIQTLKSQLPEILEEIQKGKAHIDSVSTAGSGKMQKFFSPTVTAPAAKPLKKRKGPPDCEECGKPLTKRDKAEFEADNGTGYPRVCTDCAEHPGSLPSEKSHSAKLIEHQEHLFREAGYTPLFPNAKVWSDIFGGSETGRKVVDSMSAKMGRKTETMKITNAVYVTGQEKSYRLFATPSKEVIAKLKDSLIVVGGDEIHFSVHVRNNEAYVYALYNQIIGQRNVGTIGADSIPAPADEE